MIVYDGFCSMMVASIFWDVQAMITAGLGVIGLVPAGFVESKTMGFFPGKTFQVGFLDNYTVPSSNFGK